MAVGSGRLARRRGAGSDSVVLAPSSTSGGSVSCCGPPSGRRESGKSPDCPPRSSVVRSESDDCSDDTPESSDPFWDRFVPEIPRSVSAGSVPTRVLAPPLAVTDPDFTVVPDFGADIRQLFLMFQFSKLFVTDRRGTVSHSSGISRSISSSHTLADMSDGARQSPRGDSAPPEETFGPLGSAERLNWLNE